MDTPLRVVLVGCGGISQAWLKPASQMAGLKIVGLVDLLPQNAQKRAEEFGLQDAEVSDNYTAVLDHAQPDIVFDCAVPEAHADVTVEALARGCHVLGEKPLADSMLNARRMVAAAQASGKIFAVMQNRRFIPEIRAVKSFIESGRVGALTQVNSDFYLGAHFGGFRDEMAHVLLLDMAIHTFDQARFLMNADPASVYCKEWNPAGSWYQHDASAVAIFEMTNGIVFTYRGSWCAEGLNTSWESDWRLVGRGGSVIWKGDERMSAESAEWKGEFMSETQPQSLPPYTGPQVGGHAGVIRDFVDCINTGRTPETVCTDNIKSLAMVFGAIESATEGRAVQIEC